jgi:hypothetical protein
MFWLFFTRDHIYGVQYRQGKEMKNKKNSLLKSKRNLNEAGRRISLKRTIINTLYDILASLKRDNTDREISDILSDTFNVGMNDEDLITVEIVSDLSEFDEKEPDDKESTDPIKLWKEGLEKVKEIALEEWERGESDILKKDYGDITPKRWTKYFDNAFDETINPLFAEIYSEEQMNFCKQSFTEKFVNLFSAFWRCSENADEKEDLDDNDDFGVKNPDDFIKIIETIFVEPEEEASAKEDAPKTNPDDSPKPNPDDSPKPKNKRTFKPKPRSR